MNLLEVNNVKKIYSSRFSQTQVKALDGISLKVEPEDFTAIMGESGSGKTTLLNILAALDKPTEGEVLLNGVPLQDLKGKKLSEFRRDHLGFVFQDFNLLDTFNNKDNILLPMVLAKADVKTMNRTLNQLAPRLGIQNILKKFPFEVSGGQKQRVATARALIQGPELLLADEPTAALDSKSSEDLLELFTELNKAGQTILMVTHSVKAASYANRILFIKDGRIFHEIRRGSQNNEQLYESISNTLTVMRRQESQR